MTRYRIDTFSRRDWLGRKRWYFNIRSSVNGQIVAQGEGYRNLADCLATVRGLKAGMGDAVVAVEGQT